MRITKIEIRNYKSIKKPFEINFYDELPTILIGRNGSGKTNILEALNMIAEANSNYYGSDKEPAPSYKVYIRLTKEDTDRLFPGKNIDEDKCQFIACSGENCKIDRIESEYLVPLLKSEACEIIDLANKLKDALSTYTKQLNKIACSERQEQPLRGFQLTNFRNSTTNYDTLKFQVEFVLEQVEKLTESIKQNFAVEECSFKFGYIYDYYQLDKLENLYFKLRYVKPDLASFEKKFITVNETALKREITKINTVTKDSCDKITVLLHELDERAKRLKAALSVNQTMSDNSGAFYRFLRDMQKCVGAKCSFLRNESSEVIFKTDEQKREYFRDDKSRVILQTYLNKVYKGDDKEKLQNHIQKNKDFTLSDDALHDFERYLNENIPEFENGMYDRISVEQSDGNIPSILLHEKSGETVALNSTSAGRRWYFTYYFIKNTLEPGDLFIIDEPAAMLHPIAQKEILNELLSFKMQRFNVVYSTHSPYLVPNDWKSVHFVFMEDGGTAAANINISENRSELMKSITGNDIFSLQGITEKYNCADKERIAHNCYQKVIDLYITVEDAAINLELSVETIKSWKKKIANKKFRSPKLENILLVAEKTNTDILKLLQ